jgi:GH25 family lysozyme M1 (1,4-beta-N-acetylmuramidase)
VTDTGPGVLTFILQRHQDVVDRINEAAKGPVRRFLAGSPQPMCFGVDVSHWQGPINFARVKAAGFTFVVIKATEGTGYVDPNFRAYRAQAHAAGLIVRMYHYAGSSTARRVYAWDAEAAWFMQTVGPLAVGEGADLDCEPAVPPTDLPGWCRPWLDRVATLGASPWIYQNSSTEARWNWTAAGIPARYGLWLAKYDNDPDMDPVVHWPSLVAEQYWDKATVPGIAGPVDVDVFYGTPAQLLAYCKGGAPTPAPTPGGLTLANVSDADAARLVASVDLLVQQLMGPGYTVGQAQPAPGWPGWRYGYDVSQTVVDMLRSIDRQTGSLLDLDGRPLPPEHVDNELGQVLSIRAEVAELAAKVDALVTPTDSAGLAAQLAATQAAVAQLSTALTALAAQHPQP